MVILCRLYSSFLSASLFNRDLPDQLAEDLWPLTHTHTHRSVAAACEERLHVRPSQQLLSWVTVVSQLGCLTGFGRPLWWLCGSHTEGHYVKITGLLMLFSTSPFAVLPTAQIHNRFCSLFISVPCLLKCLHLSFSSSSSSTHLLLWFILLRHSLSGANPSIHSPWWPQIWVPVWAAHDCCDKSICLPRGGIVTITLVLPGTSIHLSVSRVLCLWIYFTASFSLMFYFFSAKKAFVPSQISEVLKAHCDSQETFVVFEWDDMFIRTRNRCKTNIRACQSWCLFSTVIYCICNYCNFAFLW